MRTGRYYHVVLVAWTALSAVGQQSAVKNPPFTLSISPLSPDGGSQGPLVHVVLQSISRQSFKIPEEFFAGPQGEFDYLVDVSSKDGTAVQPTEYYRKARGGALAMTYAHRIIRTMNYGDKIEENIDIGRLFRLTPGTTYVVRVERSDEVYASMHVKSNETDVVAPPAPSPADTAHP